MSLPIRNAPPGYAPPPAPQADLLAVSEYAWQKMRRFGESWRALQQLRFQHANSEAIRKAESQVRHDAEMILGAEHDLRQSLIANGVNLSE